MIKNMRFKNWRSLKAVEINDLTPITVFIGANSSGKTNIIDALRFWRDAQERGLENVVGALGFEKIATYATRQLEAISTTLAFDYELPVLSKDLIHESLVLNFELRTFPFTYRHSLIADNEQLDYGFERQLPTKLIEFDKNPTVFSDADRIIVRKRDVEKYLGAYIRQRWQLISEGFTPPQRVDTRFAPNRYVIEPDCANWLQIVEFMAEGYPEVFESFTRVTRYLLETIRDVSISTLEDTLAISVRETNDRLAPIVSLGTRRILAIVAAIHALDMPQRNRNNPDETILPSTPSLVIVEEPDVALNPWILERFVEQLRNYTSRENPRQFILTTHNPTFLNYFQPEEVRVVGRDEDGFTTVSQIPDYIREIWLDEYGLGEVWTTGSFGGVPQ